jgi:hypothetical protein
MHSLLLDQRVDEVLGVLALPEVVPLKGRYEEPEPRSLVRELLCPGRVRRRRFVTTACAKPVDEYRTDS